MRNEPMPTVLSGDDAAENLFVRNELLKPHDRVLAVDSGEGALRVAGSQPRPDLILLGVMMPGLGGFTVPSRLRQQPDTHGIPVVMLTALVDVGEEERGLRLGAADDITKPLKPAVVPARVATQLQAEQARDWLADHNDALEAEVARRMDENGLTQHAAIRALAHLAETRDPETGNHILRTQADVRRLALGLRGHARFARSACPCWRPLAGDVAVLFVVAGQGLQRSSGQATRGIEVIHSQLGAIAAADAEVRHPAAQAAQQTQPQR